MSNWAGVTIAGLALLFTVGSFWWLNARPGRLRSYEPHTFAASDKTLRIPLVLYGSGPQPCVVRDLRISLPTGSQPPRLFWRSTRNQLKPTEGDGHRMPEVFAVAGRSAVQVFVDFSSDDTRDSLPSRPTVIRVQALVGNHKKWRTLLEFQLNFDVVKNRGQWVTYSNDPGVRWGES